MTLPTITNRSRSSYRLTVRQGKGESFTINPGDTLALAMAGPASPAGVIGYVRTLLRWAALAVQFRFGG